MPSSDIAPWLADLAEDDEKRSGSARRRLVARGEAAVDSLLRAVANPVNVKQYRGALRALGDLAAGGAIQNISAIRRLALEQLPARDGAERRSLITCLGRLGVDAQTESALLALWKDEKRDDQLRVLAAALGRAGSQASDAALQQCPTQAPLVWREIAAARAAIESRQAVAQSGEGRVLGNKPVSGFPLRLRCRRGLGPLLLKHLPPGLQRARQTGPGQIDAELRGPLDNLFDCRVWSEAVFRAANLEQAAELMRSLTEGAPTWRLEMPKASRSQLLDFVRAAQAVAPDCPNSPSRAVWELRPRGEEIELAPRFWRDLRFAYLREHIPAMTHPPLAAALALLSEPRPGDIVCDPFCGAGTELAERAKAGPYARLIGSDRDAGAISAARENLAGVERLELLTGDALSLPLKEADVLLTNPPYGRKVQGVNIADLLRRLLEKATREMRRGRIVLCSPTPPETWALARRLGWQGSFRLDVSNDHHPLEAQGFTRHL